MSVGVVSDAVVSVDVAPEDVAEDVVTVAVVSVDVAPDKVVSGAVVSVDVPPDDVASVAVVSVDVASEDVEEVSVATVSVDPSGSSATAMDAKIPTEKARREQRPATPPERACASPTPQAPSTHQAEPANCAWPLSVAEMPYLVPPNPLNRRTTASRPPQENTVRATTASSRDPPPIRSFELPSPASRALFPHATSQKQCYGSRGTGSNWPKDLFSFGGRTMSGVPTRVGAAAKTDRRIRRHR